MNKICSIEGCKNIYVTKGLCHKHNQQRYLKRGVFRDFSDGKRRSTDPNEFVIKGAICHIFLYDRKNNKIAETIIDSEDYDRCKSYKWYLWKGRAANPKVKQLSNFVMNFKSTKWLIVDHIYGNILDNRKSQLQICTTQQNAWKKKIGKNNTSGYKGVSVSTKNNKYISTIQMKEENFYLGSFLSKEEAALAYNEKAKELFGKFAVLNQVRCP